MQAHSLFFLVFLTLCSAPVWGQGLQIDTSLYDKLPRQSLYGDGGKSEASVLEGVPKVDLKPFCPKPQNQGRIGSCTAWSTGYGAMTIAFAIEANLANQRAMITDTAFSALFLYNQVRQDFSDCGKGTFIHETLELLKRTGNVRSTNFDKGNNCKKRPSEIEIEAAGQNRIKDWVALFESNSSNRVRIDKTKLSLYANKPVIIAMRTRNNFADLDASDKFWFPSIGDTSLSFFHAMVVVGFDDGKGAFEVMNSWGELWGNRGFFWLKYDDYAKHVPNAYQMSLFSGGNVVKQSLIKKDDPRTLLAAKLNVRVPLRMENGEPIFQDIPFSWKNGMYELAEPAWPIGKLYQLVATEVTAGTYLYAFSIDNNNKVNIHWPRDAALDDKFDGLKESAVITNEKVKLVIPEPQRGLILETAGADYICLLLSKAPLTDINAIIQNVKNNSALPVKTRLANALGKNAIPAAKIKFEPGTMAASSSEKIGNVLPLVIKIPVQ